MRANAGCAVSAQPLTTAALCAYFSRRSSRAPSIFCTTPAWASPPRKPLESMVVAGSGWRCSAVRPVVATFQSGGKRRNGVRLLAHSRHVCYDTTPRRVSWTRALSLKVASALASQPSLELSVLAPLHALLSRL